MREGNPCICEETPEFESAFVRSERRVRLRAHCPSQVPGLRHIQWESKRRWEAGVGNEVIMLGLKRFLPVIEAVDEPAEGLASGPGQMTPTFT